MKLVVPVLFFTAFPLLAQSGPEQMPAARPRLTAAMMLHSTSARPTESDVDENLPSTGGAVAPAGVTMMAPFATTISPLPFQITHDRPVAPAPVEHQFDWRNGGTVQRQDDKIFTIKTGVDYDPEWNVLNLFRISW